MLPGGWLRANCSTRPSKGSNPQPSHAGRLGVWASTVGAHCDSHHLDAEPRAEAKVAVSGEEKNLVQRRGRALICLGIITGKLQWFSMRMSGSFHSDLSQVHLISNSEGFSCRYPNNELLGNKHISCWFNRFSAKDLSGTEGHKYSMSRMFSKQHRRRYPSS